MWTKRFVQIGLTKIPIQPTAAKEFRHWIQTFEYYIEVLPQEGLDKLKILTNFVSPTVYDFISDCTTYKSAKETLKKNLCGASQ